MINALTTPITTDWLVNLGPWLGTLAVTLLTLRTIHQHHKVVNDKLKASENIQISLRTLESQQQHLQQTITQQHQQQLLHQQQEIRASMQEIRQQITHTLQQQTSNLTQQLQSLTQQTDKHLHNITHRVHQRLDEGFAKTNSVFTDVIKRLALIDQAQQRITD